MLIPLGKHGNENSRLSRIWTEKWDSVNWKADDAGLGILVEANVDGSLLTLPEIPLRTNAFAIITWHPDIKPGMNFMDSFSKKKLSARVPKGAKAEDFPYHVRISFGLYQLPGRG